MIVKRRKTSNIQKKACLASNQIQNSKCLFFFFFGTNVPFHTLTQIEIVDNHEYQQIKDVREE